MKRQGPVSVQLFPWAVLRLTTLEKRPLTGDRKDIKSFPSGPLRIYFVVIKDIRGLS